MNAERKIFKERQTGQSGNNTAKREYKGKKNGKEINMRVIEGQKETERKMAKKQEAQEKEDIQNLEEKNIENWKKMRVQEKGTK